MKIATITFHCAYNFGSALQTWALKKVLEGHGHDVHVIDYRGNDFNQYKLINLESMRSLVSSLVFYKRNAERMRSFESFIAREFSCTSRYTIENESAMASLTDEFDAFICGSDQIWNLDCTQGPVPPYFLSFAGDKKRVAYAPSLSHMSFEVSNFTPEMQLQLHGWLDAFDAISVRESGTAGLFQPLTCHPIKVCLDPTMLLDADEYDQIVSPMTDARGSVFVYMLEKNDSLAAYASKVARIQGMSVSYISKRRIDFGVQANNYYGVGPSEFLGLIRDAECVITNSFHATVFSLLFGRKFQTFSTERSGARMRELLKEFELEDHLVDGSRIQSFSNSNLPAVEARLQQLRRGSLEYLEDALRE